MAFQTDLVLPGHPDTVNIGAGTDAAIALFDLVVDGQPGEFCRTVYGFYTPDASQRT